MGKVFISRKSCKTLKFMPCLTVSKAVQWAVLESFDTPGLDQQNFGEFSFLSS